jgi:phosphatidylserine decarboxylase
MRGNQREIVPGGCYHVDKSRLGGHVTKNAAMRIPVAPEGWPFILPPAAGAVLFGLLGWWWPGALLLILALAFGLFFRDPERSRPDVPGAILAPADGKVVELRPGVADRFVGESTRVSIFLSPLDVHVNRSPISGLVTDVQYQRGTFLPAYRAEASDENERCGVLLQGEAFRVTVRQIAGVLARRVVCRVRPGEKLQAGERFGLIRFGSRVDLFLPSDVRVSVRMGDRVRGGESVIGVMG